MTSGLIGLAILAGITSVLWLLDYWCKRERKSHARRAAERGRK